MSQPLSLRIPQELNTLMEDLCSKMNISKTEIIRQAVVFYLTHKTDELRESFIRNAEQQIEQNRMTMQELHIKNSVLEAEIERLNKLKVDTLKMYEDMLNQMIENLDSGQVETDDAYGYFKQAVTDAMIMLKIDEETAWSMFHNALLKSKRFDFVQLHYNRLQPHNVEELREYLHQHKTFQDLSPYDKLTVDTYLCEYFFPSETK